MPLSGQELVIVTHAIRELSRRTAGRPLADVQEGALKVALLEVLLDDGCNVYESFPAKNLFWDISKPKGVLTATSTQTLPATRGYKPDIRLRKNGGRIVTLELKCRPAFGSKAQANYEYLRKDLDAVASSQIGCDVLVFVADSKQYSIMCGNNEFKMLCPPVCQVGLAPSVSTHGNLSWDGKTYSAVATKSASGYQCNKRVIVAWYQPDIITTML